MWHEDLLRGVVWCGGGGLGVWLIWCGWVKCVMDGGVYEVVCEIGL